MSYCRYSSNNWNCDLYVWYDVDEYWVVMVASNRIVGDIPKCDLADLRDGKIEKFNADHEAQMAFVKDAQRQRIGGPFDGQRFQEHTLEDLKARLLELRAAGYRFPDYVLKDVEEEIAEAAAK